MIANVVIGKPLVDPSQLLSFNQEDWENNERPITLFTNERFLPKIMVEAGIVKSVSEVKRNQPQLMIELYSLDCLWLKWGKKFLYIIVGE